MVTAPVYVVVGVHVGGLAASTQNTSDAVGVVVAACTEMAGPVYGFGRSPVEVIKKVGVATVKVNVALVTGELAEPARVLSAFTTVPLLVILTGAVNVCVVPPPQLPGLVVVGCVPSKVKHTSAPGGPDIDSDCVLK
jgi:hypothetical protein